MEKTKLDRNVVITGLTSFFTDVSSEMVYPILQAFVKTITAAQTVLLGPVLGIIEGISESAASLLKVFSGYYSDKLNKRKGLTVGGYMLSATAKAGMLLGIFGWWYLFMARFLERVGKGIRTAPRDALITESTPKEIRGRAFGFQRGMDFAGAMIGAVICYFLVTLFIDPALKNVTVENKMEPFVIVFAISIIPAFIGALILLFIKEKKSPDLELEKKERPKPNLNLRNYDRSLKFFFLAQTVFTLGNSSNQFLFVRSMDLGMTLSTVILMYILFNLVSTVLSPVFGSLSDKIGRRKLLVGGYLLYSVVYTAFGLLMPDWSGSLWVVWAIYGVYYAMTEGVEKAYVADTAPKDSKGTALGMYHTIVGVMILPANLICGVLYMLFPAAPFIFGGVTALVTVAIILLFVREQKTQESNG